MMTMTKAGKVGIKTFESQLRDIREQTGVPFSAIADKMGVSGAYISQIIKRGPTMNQIEGIADALGVNPEIFDAYMFLRIVNRTLNSSREQSDRLRASYTESTNGGEIIAMLVALERTGERKRRRLVSGWVEELAEAV